MADKNKNTPTPTGNEVDELLRMLDLIEQRPLEEDVEQTIRQYGYGEARAPKARKSTIISIPVENDLSQLLIQPNMGEEEEMAETLQQMSFLVENTTEEDMT